MRKLRFPISDLSNIDIQKINCPSKGEKSQNKAEIPGDPLL